MCQKVREILVKFWLFLVLFGPEMREMKDPQNGWEIGIPHYGYNFCTTPSIRVQLGLKQLGIVSSNYSNPLRLRLRGQ